ncbi:ECF transporter S component [Apilactobacillus kunkeei]|nr:ECF transporter S component [Apilactobacillus kunkeei]
MKNTWSLRNIILLTLISIICGIIFFATAFLYNAVSLVLTPYGLAPLANDLLLGLWVMAAPLAGFIFKRPGAPLLAEVIGSIVEMFLGGQWGVETVITGIEQGIATELGFVATKYKHFDWLGVIATTITTTVITFIYDWFKNGYNAYATHLLIIMFIVRFISIFIFGGVLSKLIANMLEKSHVIK